MIFPSTTVSTIIALAVTLVIWVSITAAHVAKSRSLGIRVAAGMTVWLAVSLYLSHSNFIFSTTSPTYFLLFLLLPPVLGGALILNLPKFRKLVAAIPQTMLIAPHLLRVIGFNFMILAELGYLPRGFARPAGYGDVITGLTVPLVLYLIISKHRWARPSIIGWNIFGLADFTSALITGPLLIKPYLLSIQQPYELNYFTMIPAFVVPLYLITHLYSLVKVVSERPAKIPETTSSVDSPLETALELQLLLRPELGEMLRNHLLNLREGDICIVEGDFGRAGSGEKRIML